MKIFYQYKMIKALIFLSLLFCFIACKKEQNEIDYRDKYVGDYIFEITHNYPVPIWYEPQQLYYEHHDTTYSYSGFIEKSTSLENRLLIHWGNDTLVILNGIVFTQSNEMIVDSSGVLSYPEYYGGGMTGFYQPAYIRNDSIRFLFGRGRFDWHTWDVLGLKKH